MNEEDKLGWLVLITVIIGTFLGSIDRTVVNLALPDVINSFGITVQAAGWIATAYILANAVFVPVWGKLGDTIGRKKVYLAGLSIFIGSSLLAGISWNFGSLVFFRVIQAIAVSADYPTAMAILTVTFKDMKKRGRALGIWSASLASGAILGPLIGGPLVDWFGWRSIFFLNVPLGLIGVGMASIFIKESSSSGSKSRFDFPGAISLGIALASIVLVLDKGTSWGWGSLKSTVVYSTGIAFFIAFYFIEKHQAEPVIDFKFFKNRAFNFVLLNTCVVYMGLMGSVFLIPLFSEIFLGYSATQAGYVFVPMALVLMIAAPLGARLASKIRPGIVISIGTFIGATGLFLYTYLDPRSNIINLVIPLSIMAFGMGLGMSSRTNLIASSAPPEEVGVASSIFVLVRNVAGAFGIAIFATVLGSRIENNVLDIARNTVINVKSPETFRQVASLIILKAQVSAYGGVFAIASALLLAGAIFAWFIKVEKRDSHRKTSRS